jgi:hypothetical protein
MLNKSAKGKNIMIKKEYKNKLVEATTISSEMLQEWNDKEFQTVKEAIRKLFGMKRLIDLQGITRFMKDYESIELFFGLPYTSSSDFAMLSNTNTIYYLDTENKYNIDCFGLGKDGKVYIFCTDADENEIVYQVI